MTNKLDWTTEVQGAVLAMKDEAKVAYAYVKQEAPQVAEEYVRLQALDGALTVAAAVTVYIAAFKGFKKLRKSAKSRDFHDEFDISIGSGACALAMLLAFIMGTCGAFEAAKCLIAPRIVVIEGIGKVLK